MATNLRKLLWMAPGWTRPDCSFWKPKWLHCTLRKSKVDSDPWARESGNTKPVHISQYTLRQCAMVYLISLFKNSVLWLQLKAKHRNKFVQAKRRPGKHQPFILFWSVITLLTENKIKTSSIIIQSIIRKKNNQTKMISPIYT